MAVAEIFAAKISPAAEPLKFEYDIEVEKQIMALTLSYLPIQQNIGKISLADTAEVSCSHSVLLRAFLVQKMSLLTIERCTSVVQPTRWPNVAATGRTIETTRH